MSSVNRCRALSYLASLSIKTSDDHIESLCKKISKRIGLLRSIRYFLPKTEQIQFYNSVIKPVLMYGSVIWSVTSQDNLCRVFRLQKRAARVILNAKVRDERTVTLFHRPNWIPFQDEIKINKCLQGTTPEYLSNKLIRVSDVSSRTSCSSELTICCPRYRRETEGGRTCLSTVTKLWNALPLKMRKCFNIKAFQKEYFNFFKDQYVSLNHFNISYTPFTPTKHV